MYSSKIWSLLRLLSILKDEQGLVKLAGVGLLPGEEEIARHLLGDGRCPLALAAADQVGAGCTQDAGVVDAAVLVEAIVLGGQNGVLQDRGNVLNGDDGPALLAVFADQVPVGGVNTQRNLRAVVGQYLERWQVRVGQDQDDQHHRYANRHKPENDI